MSTANYMRRIEIVRTGFVNMNISMSLEVKYTSKISNTEKLHLALNWCETWTSFKKAARNLALQTYTKSQY